MTDWALAVTAPQCEHLVCRDLRERFSIPYHFFQQRKRLVWRGQVIERAVPAFPRYVMVPLEAAWYVARQCWRVTDLVRWGERLAPVSQATIDDLLARGNGGYLLPMAPVRDPFRIGQLVQISGYGPMAGHSGLYQQQVDDGKLSVMFDWMGRWVSIDIDARDVSAAIDGRARKKKKRRHHRSKRHNLQSLSA